MRTLQHKLTLINAVHLPISDPTWIFFLILGIILFAPMLFERVRIPSIVGLIFAGLLVGPHGFHVLDRDSSFELFGRVGLYYIMFLASLEMNLQELRETRGRALGFGLLSFAIPIGLGFIANFGLLGLSVAASLLMASMYASHTLISYPIVLRYGLQRRQSVNMAVGGTIVADTLTLLILAVVASRVQGETDGWLWLWLVAKLALAGAAIVFIFPKIVRAFFNRYNDGVVQYVFVLILVFLGAGLMELAGMDGILGAFLVGIVLNRQIPATSPLMNHIEFIGNALFIPFFLISVGMLIDLRALADLHALEMAAVMVVFATAGKWLASLAAQYLYNLPREDRALLFGLTGARAAATLAIVLVGYELQLPDGSHLFSEAVLNGAMLLILFSCLVSSVVTERAAAKVLSLPDAKAEARQGSKLESDRIIIAIKEKDDVQHLVHFALMLRRPKSPEPLSAINVVLENDEAKSREGSEALEYAANISASAEVRMLTHSRYSVNVVSGLSHSMKELDASDLIIGLHRQQKMFEAFFGQIATDLIRVVDRQIIIFRPSVAPAMLRRIHLIVPRKAEKEPGFGAWLRRIALLSAQVSCTVDVYGGRGTLEKIQETWEEQGHKVQAEYHRYDKWNDYTELANATRSDHLVCFVLARPGTLSYHTHFTRLPGQIQRYFSSRSLMMIYPAQNRGTIGKTSVLIAK